MAHCPLAYLLHYDYFAIEVISDQIKFTWLTWSILLTRLRLYVFHLFIFKTLQFKIDS